MTLAILITASGSVSVFVALVADASVIVILRTTAIAQIVTVAFVTAFIFHLIPSNKLIIPMVSTVAHNVVTAYNTRRKSFRSSIPSSVIIRERQGHGANVTSHAGDPQHCSMSFP